MLFNDGIAVIGNFPFNGEYLMHIHNTIEDGKHFYYFYFLVPIFEEGIQNNNSYMVTPRTLLSDKGSFRIINNFDGTDYEIITVGREHEFTVTCFEHNVEKKIVEFFTQVMESKFSEIPEVRQLCRAYAPQLLI